MRLDPKGYYAELDVQPRAPAAEIVAAYRRKARSVHPDIPGTGSLDAFLRLQTAYDVVGNPVLRAAYDREARTPKRPLPAAGQETGPPVPPDLPDAPSGLRVGGLPMPIALLLAGVVCLTAVTGVLQVIRVPPPRHETVPQRGAPPPEPAAPSPGPGTPQPAPPPALPPEPAALQPAPPTPERLPGSPTHFIQPGPGPARLWHGDPEQPLTPGEMLLPFTAVHLLQLLPRDGLVQIELADGRTGYVDAVRLVPGSEAAARRAYCAYNAGPVPENAEVLERHGAGASSLRIENHGAQPMVVKLRTGADETAASVFVVPGGVATVDGLPDGPYLPEFAIGELWSRACNAFAAGMRSQRFGAVVGLDAVRRLVIPPDASGTAPPIDIPDSVFTRD